MKDVFDICIIVFTILYLMFNFIDDFGRRPILSSISMLAIIGLIHLLSTGWK